LSFLEYKPGTSFMYKASPFKKLVLILMIIILTLLWNDPYYLVGVVAFLLIMSGMSKTISEWPRMFLWISPAIIAIFVLQALFYIPRSNPIILGYLIPFDGGGIGAITLNGIFFGLSVVLKFLCIFTVFSIFLMTTSYRDIMYFMKYTIRLHPVVTTIVSISLASIRDVMRMFGTLMEAQKARGVEYEKANFVEKLKRYFMLLRPCFYNLFMKADQTAIALQIRVSEISRGREIKAKITVTDYLTLLAAIIIILTLIYLRFAFSVGFSESLL